MKTPTIGIYVSTASDDTSPRFEDDYYAKAYADLLIRILKLGAQPLIVYDAAATYSGNGIFNKGWLAQPQNDGKVKYTKSNEPFKINLLYDKNRFPASDLAKLNPNKIKQICNNKYLTYLFAPDFHAKSFLIQNETELDTFGLSHAHTDVALKELDSNGGEKVFVGKFADYQGPPNASGLHKPHQLNFPLLAQEFIDTSEGTPDGILAKSHHDVRVCLFDRQPIGGLLRIPRTGTLKSNQNLGGYSRSLFVREIPKDLVEKTAELDARFDTTNHRLFAADWGFDKTSGQWKLFELNNMPGLVHRSVDGPAADEYLQLLAENLVKAAQQ